MNATCPAGHISAADDYCDVCGMPIGDAPRLPGSGAPAAIGAPIGSPVLASTDAPSAAQACPHCNVPNPADALFCEACGYDFTTGSMPRPPEPLAPPDGSPAAAAGATAVAPPAPPAADGDFAWVVERWVDPAWYAEQESPDPLPSAGLPVVQPLRGTSLLVGRTSQSRGIHPDVDCATDSGVSRRQCQLTTDGTRWWVEDLDSANGTFVGRAGAGLPEDPVPRGTRRELGPDDRVYVGGWTRLVVRAATDDERATLR